VTSSTFGPDRRATSPVVGVALLVLVTAILAAGLGAAVLGTVPAEPPPQTRLSISVDGDRLRVVHQAGDTLDVRRMEVHVAVNGTRLAHQPPVPFFAATGFAGGPTGPFNSASDGAWRAGETAAVELAGTNSPRITEGSRVTVTVATDRGVVTERTTTAG
jgi:FlaG/FlaF family flagellin (archaellin)